MRNTFVFAVLLSLAMTVQSKADADDECVVLLHGLGRTAWSMRSVANYLEKSGYLVVNQGYDSTSATIEQLARHVVPVAVARCGLDVGKIHFVTHSHTFIMRGREVHQQILSFLQTASFQQRIQH